MTPPRPFDPATAEKLFSPHGTVLLAEETSGKERRWHLRVRTGPWTFSAIWNAANKTSPTAEVAVWKPSYLPIDLTDEDNCAEVTVAAFLRALKAGAKDDRDGMIAALVGGE